MLTNTSSKAEVLNTLSGLRVSNISRSLRSLGSEYPQREAPATTVLEPEIEIRPIRGAEELDSVYRLTHDSFLERGYCQPQPDGPLIHYPHLDNIPETTVLVAVVQGEIMGTLSFTLDGPRGFHLDGDFKTECGRIRAEGKAWRLSGASPPEQMPQ